MDPIFHLLTNKPDTTKSRLAELYLDFIKKITSTSTSSPLPTSNFY